MNILITVIEFIKLNFSYIQFQNTVLAMTAIIIVCKLLFEKIERENQKDREKAIEFFNHYIEEHSIQIKQFE